MEAVKKPSDQKKDEKSPEELKLEMERQRDSVIGGNQFRYNVMLHLTRYYYGNYFPFEVDKFRDLITEGSEKHKTSRAASRDIERQIENKVGSLQRKMEKFKDVMENHNQEYIDAIEDNKHKTDYFHNCAKVTSEAFETAFHSGRADDLSKVLGMFSQGMFDTALDELKKKQEEEKKEESKPKAKTKNKSDEKESSDSAKTSK